MTADARELIRRINVERYGEGRVDLGVPASGNRVEITGNDIGILRDGKLIELWGEVDMLYVMTQLGAIEPPTG